MSWYLYITKARTNRYYTGISINPEQRISDHNTHSGSRMGKQQGPFKLVYISKPFATKSAARRREMQVKGWVRTKKEKLIKGKWE